MDAACFLCPYVVSLEGGAPRKIAENENAKLPTWSPDSNSVVVKVTSDISSASKKSYVGLRTIDLQTGKISSIPDSGKKGGTFWVSRDMLVAPTLEGGEMGGFVTFDFKTQKWTLLVRGHFNHWMPSVDGKYLYLMAAGDDPKVLRVRLSDRKLETITSLKNFRPVEDEETGMWIGVAPDGSPLLTRDVGTQEIYELSVRWP
jgi:hypothetical protein